MKLPKVTAMIGILALVISLLVPTMSNAAETKATETKVPSIEKFEEKRQEIISEQMKHYYEEFEDQSKNLGNSEKKELKQQIKEERDKVIDKKLERLNTKYGWEKLEDPLQMSPLSYSSHMNIYGDLYVSSYDSTYRYEGHFDWTGTLDPYGNAEDIASVGVNTNIDVTQTYATTYDNLGRRTGSEANGADSGHVSLRTSSEGNGAAWNVRDGNYNISGREVYATTELRVVMYFKASGNFKVYPSYVHDWNTRKTSTSGSIGFSGITPSGSLSVSTSSVPHSWGPKQGRYSSSSSAIVR